MTHRPENVKEFMSLLKKALSCPANTSAAQRWECHRDTIYSAASLTFGKNKQKADWFEAHLDEAQPFIDEKKRALAFYKSSPCERTLHTLRAA